MRITGTYKKVDDKNFFIPYPLPPANPTLNLTPELLTLYGEAMGELSKLNEISKAVPDKRYFIKAYLIKEALLSSEIEGVHTTLAEIFTQPLLNTMPDKNTQLVMNYTDATYSTLGLMKERNLPISSRVICKAHEILLQDGEGDKYKPGCYRDKPVKVGNLLPAPTKKEIEKLMAQLEEYINLDQTLPPLIKAGLAHVQFETIHPFFDGNGRIGRLLIILILIENGLLLDPILYPSYYFKKHQLTYYEKLDIVRTQGNFEEWIHFFLTAIKESAIDAYERAKEIEKLNKQYAKIIYESSRSDTKDLKLNALSIIFIFPVISVKELASQLDISYNTAKAIISEFIKLKILLKKGKQKRNQLFEFKPYICVINKEYN